MYKNNVDIKLWIEKQDLLKALDPLCREKLKEL